MHEAMTVHHESKTAINLVLRMCLCYSLSRVRLCAAPWTAARQAPLSMDFPGKVTGVGCHFLLQGILPDPGVEPESPALAGGF